jgi:hypothetical protein
MKIYGKCCLARAWMIGLIVLAPAGLAWAEGTGPVRGEQTDGHAVTGPRARSSNRPPQAQRMSPESALETAPRGRGRELQRNQAFRPNFDNPRSRGRMGTRSGPATSGGNRQTVADVDRRQPPPIIVVEFTNFAGCALCRQAAPIVQELIHDGYPIVVVDLAKKPQLAEKFGIEGVPTFVRVEHGRETGRALGAQSADDLASFCEGEDRDDDDNGDEDDGDDDEYRATEMPGPTLVDRPAQSGRRPVMRERPKAGARRQLPDRGLASSLRIPPANDARPMQGNPANLRRLPPIGNGRPTIANPAELISRGSADVPDSG